MSKDYIPKWTGAGGRIDEVRFAREYIESHPIQYCEGSFFGIDGRIRDENTLRHEIYKEISPHVTTAVAKRVDRLMAALRLEAAKKPLPCQEQVIHLANGAFHLSEGFFPQKVVCRYRLPVNYDENWTEPKLWLEFLNQLLEPEDIETLQEYMGYCLLPITYAQKMLVIVGRGGEGKSRIGVVMHALLGDNMVTGSLAKIESSPFARADLEHSLLMVDDDLKLEDLPSTHHIKTIVTAEGPMDLERKGIQSYQGRLHCRFMAFGNDTLWARSDTSHGFYRRQIILQTKPRPKDRVDDPYLGKRLVKERDAIFCWAVEGLNRLIGHDFRFSISPRSRAIMENAEKSGSSVAGFLDSQGYVRLDPEGTASTRSLYQRYREWCEDNASEPLSARSFSRVLQRDCDLPIEYTTHVHIGNGRYARGFRGIRLCSGF